jgi:hypothetical protein
MVDPLSGDAIRKVGGAGGIGGDVGLGKDLGGKAGASKFETMRGSMAEEQAQEIGKQREVLSTDLNAQIDKIPPSEKARLEQDFNRQVAPLERPEQARYYATKIESSREVFIRLRRNGSDVPEGPAKDKLVDTLQNYQNEYSQMDGWLNDFSSGKEFSEAELLAVQVRLHQITENLEILTKAVEHSVSGMKTIFQTNV